MSEQKQEDENIENPTKNETEPMKNENEDKSTNDKKDYIFVEFNAW